MPPAARHTKTYLLKLFKELVSATLRQSRWIVAKLVLTAVGTAILLAHMRDVSRVAAAAAAGTMLDGFDEARRHLVVHAAGGIGILLAATFLSIYKPWGRTPRGRQKTR